MYIHLRYAFSSNHTMLIKQCVAFFGDEGPLINACIICVKNVD